MSLLDPIKPLLLTLASGAPLPSIALCFSPETPAVTLRSCAVPDGYCAQLRRTVETAAAAEARGCATGTQLGLLRASRPMILRGLEEEHSLLLALVYLIPPARTVYIFELAGKFLPDCNFITEEVALAVVIVEEGAARSAGAECIRVVRDSASAGRLPVWTVPVACAARVELLAWVNASAYARPVTVTLAVALSSLLG